MLYKTKQINSEEDLLNLIKRSIAMAQLNELEWCSIDDMAEEIVKDLKVEFQPFNPTEEEMQRMAEEAIYKVAGYNSIEEFEGSDDITVTEAIEAVIQCLKDMKGEER